MFKRSRPEPEVEPLRPAPRHPTVPLAELRCKIDASALGFASTDDLEPIYGLIGQDRALNAIRFGTDMRAHDFNLFVLGPPASGKSTAVRAYLATKVAKAPAPFDWVYVNNFEDRNRPRAVRLPCGRARGLASAMVAAVDELRSSVPAVFEADDYQARRRQIEEGFRSDQEKAFEALSGKAHSQDIAIIRTPMGFAMAPTSKGEVIRPEVFKALPEETRRAFESNIQALQKELQEILESVPKSDKARRQRVSELNAEFAEIVVRAALDEIRTAFQDLDDVKAYLDAVHADLVRNIGLLLPQGEEEGGIVQQPADTSRDPRFRRYMVNIMVANGHGTACTAPIVEELNPTYGNVIGRIENIAQMGALITDFLLIKPGALHRANGGYLLLDARKLLLSPFAWEAMKRTIKAREIRIEQPAEAMGLISTQTLDPEPIPLDVKVVLFGDRELYYLLTQFDPDFARLFKVQADFDDSIKRSSDNDRSYARIVATIVKEHGLKPVDASGIARLIEEGARMADDRSKLTIEIGRIADIVREADYWAKEAGHAKIGVADVSRAVEEHIQRSDRLRDRSQEIIERDIVMIDTAGGKVGQINGLSVLQLGSFSFGRPSRITARVRMGQGRVTDIEREVKLGGPLHSKGVMILWGFLAGRYAQDVPLALAATLVFEQSYGGVEGDSASSTELYALLSALSGVPIKQGLAVTGSVNQWGEVQAIGGVNEKIEGFFDICKTRGLSGDQGVLVPRSNVQHLMLREDVVEAVRNGQFAIYSVGTIDQGIEILTGVKAGDRDKDGNYPGGTINSRVEGRLREFAERARRFAKQKGEDDEGADKS
ncbi:MAG: AAA family ATPase [Hyphomicrobiaceae bacterium]|nr:MAG: AAA family ATPase [Hyphomicrobiaceae bacterium]